MGLKEKTVKGFKWNTVATIYGMLLQVFRLAILTRLLPKSDFGLIAIASMVISFTDIFSDIGITVGIIHKQDTSNKELSSAYWLNLFMSLILFVLVWLVSPLVASFYNEEILCAVIPFLAIQIIINAFGKIFHTIRTKQLDFKFISVVRIITSTLGIVCTTIFALLGWGVYSLVAGQLIQTFVNQLIFVIAGRKEIRITFHFRWNEVASILKIGVFQIGAKFFDFVSSKIDVFLIGKIFGMDDLGIYNLAKDLVMKPYQIIASIVSGVVSSTFAKIQQYLDQVRCYYLRLIKTITFLSIPLYFAVFVFSDIIVAILYSGTYSDISPLLRILSIVGLCSSIDGIAGSLQVAFGRTDLGFYWTLFRTIFSVTAILVCYRMTISAVAVGQSLVALISYPIYWFMVIYPIINVKFNDYFNAIKKNLFVSIILSVPYLIICSLFDLGMIIQVALLISYFIAYGIWMWKFERSFVKESISLVSGGRSF